MSTAAQALANIANARLSTGPVTDQGKAASSRNSLKHGLTAKTVLLPGEDPAEYQTFTQSMTKDLAPGDAVESSLAQELIDLQWRLQRVPRLEASILADEIPDFKALNNVSLHAARLKRQYSATLKEFQQFQKARNQREQLEMEQAAILRRADIILKRPTDLAQFGFVFTVDKVDRYIGREDALSAAIATLTNAGMANRTAKNAR